MPSERRLLPSLLLRQHRSHPRIQLQSFPKSTPTNAESWFSDAETRRSLAPAHRETWHTRAASAHIEGRTSPKASRSTCRQQLRSETSSLLQNAGAHTRLARRRLAYRNETACKARSPAKPAPGPCRVLRK